VISSVSPISVRHQQVRSFAGSGWVVSIWHTSLIFSAALERQSSRFCRTFYNGHFIDPALTDIIELPQAPTNVWSIIMERFCFCILEGVLKKA